jgi:hypothetical protein
MLQRHSDSPTYGSPASPNFIHAELIGSCTAIAAGVVAVAYAPVLELCRQLVARGFDPATPLTAYRGSMPCLVVRSFGEAADLEINANGTGFRRRRATDAASPIRSNGGEGL